MKKRLFVYLSVLIGCLFIGLTTYYMLKSYEYISVIASSGDEIYLNIEETDSLSIIHNNPAENTELSVTISDESIISFDIGTGVITALKGGEATLTINSTNEDYGPFTFTVKVGDGLTSTTPYYIKTVEDLQSIGKTRTYNETSSNFWRLDSYYKLINGLNLANVQWTAIGSYDQAFTGQFFGDNKSIDNLTITGEAECAGLFARLSNLAIIDSLKFNSVSINGSFEYCGVVAGISSGSTISRIEVISANILTAPRLMEEDGLIKAYSMVGGIVGTCDIEYWAEEGIAIGYGYTRSTITMCSFTGTIGANSECLAITPTTNKMYMTYGGIVGFSLGSTILNNKAEANFDFSSEFATLTRNTADTITLSVKVGGIVGLIKEKDIENDTTTVGKVYPVVKNNLAVITFDNLTDTYGGVIGKTPITVQYVTGQQWVSGNYFYADNTALTFGGCSSDFANATVRITNISNLKKQATYVTDETENWNMGESISVWSIVEDESVPEINYNGIEQTFTYDSEVYTITNATEFKKYYDKMTSGSASTISKKFWLSQSYTLTADINIYDAGITGWIPIGYDFTFMGTFDGNNHKIYFNDETTTTISFVNTQDEDGNYTYILGSIFSVINTNAEVKNLTIEGFEINYAEFAGGIASINNGTITNCYAKDIKIQNAKYAGFVTGFNSGTIQNTVTESETIVYTVSVTAVNQINIPNSNNTVYVGGITGYNTGLISNIKISGVYTIIGETTENDVIRVLGGAIGYNKGEVINCAVEQGYLSDNSKVRIYVGGFCGINDGAIKSSYTGMEEGGLFTTVTTDVISGNQVAGGFVAYLGYNGTIEKSFANITVTGYYAAGLAADLLGTVSECYVKGSITGEYIGGFACNLAFASDSTRGGSITNCYNTVSLTGSTENSLSAGLVLFIRAPGKVETCFISNSFKGLGKKYYESYTDTRFELAQKLTAKISPINLLGTVNAIVINTETDGAVNEEVISNGEYFTDKNQTVVYLTKESCLLGKTTYEALGFSVSPTAYWTIEEGSFPILTNLNLDGIPQIVEASEEDVKTPGDDVEPTGDAA